MEKKNEISALSVAFIIIGALFGAAFASGQEVLKFFGAYGNWGIPGFAVCFLLYLVFGYMVYELSRVRSSGKMEEIVAPTDNIIIKKIIGWIMLFCFAVVVIALFAAGDALFAGRTPLPKGVGGLLIAIPVVVTNIVGFEGIKKVFPKIVPAMLIIMLVITLTIVFCSEQVPPVNPGKYMSPLAPNWLLGAILYVSYNSLATIPIFSSLPKTEELKKKVIPGMFLGFLGTCVFGLLLYFAVMTDVDAAGQYDLPMVYLCGKLSPVVSVVYSLLMVAAIYSAASNCLYGLTKELKRENPKKRILTISLIGATAYLVSLAGFSQLVTYVYPIQGYACILVIACVIITFMKYANPLGKKMKK